MYVTYRKIPKITPGACIFQRPFLRGLFLEGLIFGGAYLWREICGYKSIMLLYFVFEGNFPGTLYLEGQFNGGFFVSPVWGANIWRGLFLEFYSIRKSMRVSENIYVTFM